MRMAHRFFEQATGSVTGDGFAQALASDKTVTVVGECVRGVAQEEP